MTHQELLDMPLHSETYISNRCATFYCTRVVGGWIYSYDESAIFVPEIPIPKLKSDVISLTDGL